jgi:hypothetical protein
VVKSWLIPFYLFVAAGSASAADLSIAQVLTEALLCKGDPAKAVFDLERQGSDFSKGVAVHGFGDGAGHKTVVILASPLRIGSATAYAVVAETEASYFDFGAFTYALFTGDARAAVALLKLEPAKSKDSLRLGAFVSRQAPAASCPRTVALTPVEGGKFLLGCGWCNGG